MSDYPYGTFGADAQCALFTKAEEPRWAPLLLC